MIVHFIGSAQNIDEDLPYIDKIFEAVNKQGGRIIRDWPHAAHSRRTRGVTYDQIDWRQVFLENLEAIRQAELVIAEASTYSFNQGYYLCSALHLNKPTLLVTRHNLKERSLSGITHEMLTTKQYQSEDELNALVTDFINSFQSLTHKNIELSPKTQYNLARLVKKTGKTETVILEDLTSKEV